MMTREELGVRRYRWGWLVSGSILFSSVVAFGFTLMVYWDSLRPVIDLARGKTTTTPTIHVLHVVAVILVVLFAVMGWTFLFVKPYLVRFTDDGVETVTWLLRVRTLGWRDIDRIEGRVWYGKGTHTALRVGLGPCWLDLHPDSFPKSNLSSAIALCLSQAPRAKVSGLVRDERTGTWKVLDPQTLQKSNRYVVPFRWPDNAGRKHPHSKGENAHNSVD